ncbi:MAG: prephenate dehydrogenase/arogenate dehydrogenase family protein [Spirochaetales bacterium]|nr:prephenate dehydrogenase/arogenate dehydrogenase family protein [Spirochaetales bacterium]
MRIAVLGTGKMGSWLATELALEHDVATYDPAGSGEARTLGSLEELRAMAPELLLNCAPLGMTIDVFESALPFLPATCVLSDIASVKTALGAWYASTGRPFVSTHPMFGPTYTDARNLSEQNAVIISESLITGKAFWRSFYEERGITVFEDSFDGHDQTVAYSLGTPFASTMVFAACMKRLDAPGTNFRKHMEIARGLLAEDDRLLAEIMFNPHTIRRLELINSQLAYLTHIIKDRDHEEMSKFLGKLRDNIGDSASA